MNLLDDVVEETHKFLKRYVDNPIVIAASPIPAGAAVFIGSDRYARACSQSQGVKPVPDNDLTWTAPLVDGWADWSQQIKSTNDIIKKAIIGEPGDGANRSVVTVDPPCPFKAAKGLEVWKWLWYRFDKHDYRLAQIRSIGKLEIEVWIPIPTGVAKIATASNLSRLQDCSECHRTADSFLTEWFRHAFIWRGPVPWEDKTWFKGNDLCCDCAARATGRWG